MENTKTGLFHWIVTRFFLVNAVVLVFISGCTFSGVEEPVKDNYVAVTEQKTECQCETILNEETNTVEAVTETLTPVEPSQTMKPEDIDNEIEPLSDSFMNGKTVIQWVSRTRPQSDTSKKLLLIDKNHIFHYLGDFAGSPAISPDGNKLGIGCPNSYPETEVTEICILDIGTITNNISQYPDDYPYLSTDKMIERLTLPEKCWSYQYNNQEYFTSYSGILSLSWSPEADWLALVCGDQQTTEVCILSMDDETICWDPMISEDVYRINWSPTDENVLAISGNPTIKSKIYLVSIRKLSQKHMHQKPRQRIRWLSVRLFCRTSRSQSQIREIWLIDKSFSQVKTVSKEMICYCKVIFFKDFFNFRIGS